MAKPKWYSPQLSRQVVALLYRKAKDARLPMTVVANQSLSEALRPKELINTTTHSESSIRKNTG